MRKEANLDLVRELCQIQPSADLTAWKQQHHEVKVELIHDAMIEVRRLLDAAEFDRAGRLSEWCVSLAQDLADPMIRARVLVTRGIALARVNEHANALSYFDEALCLYAAAGDEFMAAKVRINRIASYTHLSRYDEALRDGEINNEVLTRLGEKQLLARTLNNLGEVLFRADRFQEWLTTLQRSENLLREIGDRKSLALVYMNHAVAFTSLNRSSEALRYYQLSRQLSEETGQTWLAAITSYNLGYLHYVQGQYTQALDILKQTRDALPAEQWHVQLCDLTQSEIYLEMNMLHEAIHYAKSAYESFEVQKKAFEMAKAVGVLAVAHSQLRDFKEAAELFERARTMFLEQGNEVRAATVDLYRGLMWLKTGRYSEARDAAQQAYATFINQDVKPKAALASVVSARANLMLGELEAAQDDAAMAISLHDKSPAPSVCHQLHAVLGEIHLARNDMQTAREEFSKAIDEMERVRVNIAPDDLRLNFLKDKVPVYEMLLNADLRLGDDASLREAFVTGERARSRILVDLLAGSIDSLRHVTSSSVEDVQEALATDAALVEYFMTGNKVMAFCLSRGRFEVIQDICSRDDLKKHFEFLQFHFFRVGANPAAALARPSIALLNIQDHLAALYRMLVRPLETFLTGAKSLIFVPFDFLHYLPFHALFDGGGYLADRFQISYAPTATIYRLFKKKPVDSGGAALLIGVPDERAPFIGSEIESICSVLGNSRSFIGAEATQEQLTRQMTDAEIIHIASHASFRPDNPMFSSIQLHDKALNFFDIYNLRTNASLITLSGCGTGLSSIVAGDELMGLVRGFLYAGATSVVISLWDVNDQTTADLMRYFYSNLAAGHPKSESLRLAMLRLRQDHPHPYYWAPFLLMGDPS
ncbi:MAG TPA: CHAT domain-containing protein [Terriglobia bacterium]|nr:CHAT domain-containing protein [Terriglobia bacterium]